MGNMNCAVPGVSWIGALAEYRRTFLRWSFQEFLPGYTGGLSLPGHPGCD